jgi:hypothetical protein
MIFHMIVTPSPASTIRPHVMSRPYTDSRRVGSAVPYSCRTLEIAYMAGATGDRIPEISAGDGSQLATKLVRVRIVLSTDVTERASETFSRNPPSSSLNGLWSRAVTMSDTRLRYRKFPLAESMRDSTNAEARVLLLWFTFTRSSRRRGMMMAK